MGAHTFIDAGKSPMLQVVTDLNRRRLPDDSIRALRDGLATCKTSRWLSHQAHTSVAELCRTARKSDWTMEQLIVAVKEACYQSAEIARLTTTSERDALVSTVVTACIQEFYAPALVD